MKKDKGGLYFLILLTGVIIWVLLTPREPVEPTGEESAFAKFQRGEISAFDSSGDGSITCLTNGDSKPALDFLSTKIDLTQKDIEYFNSLPSCRDFCLEQKEYSEKYDDWWAEDDVRQSCEELGIMLPK